MLSRRERYNLTALADQLSAARPDNAPIYRRTTQLTFQHARYERRALILRCVGVAALWVASNTAPSPVAAVLTVVTLVLVPLLVRDSIRQRKAIAREQRDRSRRCDGTMSGIVADLRHEIVHGPAYALRNEWHYWNWRCLPWWTTQIANVTLVASVALALIGLHIVVWLAFVAAALYAVLVWTTESLLVSTFVLQRKALLEGLLA
jgi:hypothetical protein